MFDGGNDPEPVHTPVRLVRYVDRGGAYPVKFVYTGAPSLARQLAGQVRSGTGMTFGVKTHDGARMPPGYSSYGFPAGPPLQAPAERLAKRIMTRLQEIADAGSLLPAPQKLLQEFGKNLWSQLAFMQATGLIDVRLPVPVDWMVIRINASGVCLRTADAPDTVRF